MGFSLMEKQMYQWYEKLRDEYIQEKEPLKKPFRLYDSEKYIIEFEKKSKDLRSNFYHSNYSHQSRLESNAFIAGGFSSYLLNITNQYGDVDIFIQYKFGIKEYLKYSTYLNNQTGERMKIWISSDYFNGSRCSFYTCSWEAGMYNFDVFTINENLPFVKWLRMTNEYLKPIQIILYNLPRKEYQTSLSNIYPDIVDVLTTFDVPACKTAILLYNHDHDRTIRDEEHEKNSFDEICLPIAPNAISIPYHTSPIPLTYFYKYTRCECAARRELRKLARTQKYNDRMCENIIHTKPMTLLELCYEVVYDKLTSSQRQL